jgi:hypothetical protein
VDALQPLGVVVVGLAADRPAALAEVPAQVGAPRRLARQAALGVGLAQLAPVDVAQLGLKVLLVTTRMPPVATHQAPMRAAIQSLPEPKQDGTAT